MFMVDRKNDLQTRSVYIQTFSESSQHSFVKVCFRRCFLIQISIFLGMFGTASRPIVSATGEIGASVVKNDLGYGTQCPCHFNVFSGHLLAFQKEIGAQCQNQSRSSQL